MQQLYLGYFSEALWVTGEKGISKFYLWWISCPAHAIPLLGSDVGGTNFDEYLFLQWIAFLCLCRK